jgi:hypothetical protein
MEKSRFAVRKAVFRVSAAVLMCCAIQLHARADSDPVERLGLDPVLHGIWTIHASSKNKGRTIEPVEPPQVLCQAFATKVKLANGTTLHIEKVLIAKDDSGNPMNIVRFDNDVIWGISKKPGSRYVLVQVMEAGSAKEKLRVLVTVEE